MRIVAGEAKGRTIAAPEGLDTRPTTDRVREALFSSLYSLRGPLEGACVLDAFAGSGALGLEALSRGARRAVFFESNAKAAATLRKNVEACRFADKAAIRKADVLSARFSADLAFDVVFLDPPYAMDPAEIMGFISGLVDAHAAGGDTLVVYEHALKSREDVRDAAQQSGFEVRAQKKYGKTGVTVLELPAHEEEA